MKAFADLNARIDSRFDDVNRRIDNVDHQIKDVNRSMELMRKDVASIRKDVEHIKNWTYSDQNSDMVIKLERVVKH